MTPAPIEEALLSIWKRIWPPIRRRLRAIFERAADVVRPDPPMTVRTLDGEILTGILIVDRGQVLAFLGTRQPAASRAPPHQHRPHDYYDDEPLWDRHGQPYGR